MKYGFLVLCSLMAGLCAPENKTDDTDNGTTDLPDSCQGGTTIADVQQGSHADGDGVTIACAVVTGGLTATGDGFFVQDPGGGAWSGMYIYLYGGMDPDEFDISVGDLVTLEGTVSEWNDLTEISLATSYDLAVIGEYPETVDPVDCGTSDWEPWEGCLISIDGLEMTSWPDSYGQVDTSCGVTFDDLYFTYGGGTGSVCTPVTAPLTYTYEAYRLVPRDELDMASCTDPADADPTTISDLLQSDPADGDYVVVEDVVVTTQNTDDGEMFFVQDEGGGEWSGIAVYLGKDSFDVTVGMVLDISGTLDDYYDLWELKPTSIEDTGATSTAVATELNATPSDWEVHEGSLITLADVEITSDADSYGEVGTNYGINVNDLFYQANASSGASFGSVTGVLNYNYDAYKLEPRDASDFVE